MGRKEELLAEFRALAAARVARDEAAASMLAEHRLISVQCYGAEIFLMFHPSTVINGGWQVSYFGTDGPMGHAENADQSRVIAQAFDNYPPKEARVVGEQEFIGVTQTDEFRRGVDRVAFIAFANRWRHDYHGERAEEIYQAAHNVQSIAEAVEIFRRGAAELEAKIGQF